MTSVIFVRHAQPVHSHGDDRTRPLTAEGQADCELVVQTLRGMEIDGFYCSPYKRSIDTVAGAAADHGMPIQTDGRFREREAGEEGNTHEKMRMRWADHDFHEPGGESLSMVQRRNVEALGELLDKHRNGRIVIGTHGTALSTILNYYRPEFGFADFMRILDWMPYIVELRFEGTDLMELRELAHIYKEFRK